VAIKDTGFWYTLLPQQFVAINDTGFWYTLLPQQFVAINDTGFWYAYTVATTVFGYKGYRILACL
jgi:hypothetical protein